MQERINQGWVAERLRRAGARSKHSLGQHFLVDENVLAAVVEAGDVQSGDTVVEIGPGLGVLTEVLLNSAAKVIVCEFDATMAAIIRSDFAAELASGKLELIEGDAIQVLPAVLARLGVYKVVANIPYQITTPLIGLLFEQGPRPVLASLLVQREVAERLTAPAKTGERSFLSVLCQYFAVASLEMLVPPTAFSPAPEVDSAVLKLVTKKVRALPETEEKRFFRYVKMAFQQRRKQLKNVLAGIRGISVAGMEAKLVAHGLPASVRAQELSENEWVDLFKNTI